MGVFNNFGEYNAEEEAARRAENLRCLEENFVEIETKTVAVLPTAKIEKTSVCGTSYSAICPTCGKLIFLSKELNTMSAICNKCHCVFKLEK